MQQLGGTVYLLHFHSPIAPSRHTAQHYIGWAYNLSSRMQAHMRGRGARLTQVAHERGITFELAATWPGSKKFERTIENKKMGWRLCPICRAARRQPPASQLPLNLPEWDDNLL